MLTATAQSALFRLEGSLTVLAGLVRPDREATGALAGQTARQALRELRQVLAEEPPLCGLPAPLPGCPACCTAEGHCPRHCEEGLGC